MKKTVSAIISVLLAALLLTACGGKATDGLGKLKLEDTFTAGKYKGVTVDTSSEEFKKEFDALVANDAQKYGCFDKKTEGKVENGNVANIDYVGKKDGVAFDGGTASGYDLAIGSGTFIAGFESGLIGVSVGETVDLNLKFPENYGNDLAGQAVVFTVTVNYINVAQGYEKVFDKAGYKSADDYKNYLTEKAAKTLLIDKIISDSKLKKVPDDETFKQVVLMNASNDDVLEACGMSLGEYIETQYSGQLTLQQYADSVSQQFTMDAIMSNETFTRELNKILLMYSVYEKEDIEIDEDSLEDSEGAVKAYEESLLVSEKAIEFIYKNAKIK